MTPGPVGNLYDPSKGRIAARIGFGDNNNYSDDKAGAFDISYFNYRRASIPYGRVGLRSPAEIEFPSNCTQWQTLSEERALDANLDLGGLIPEVSNRKYSRAFKVTFKLLDTANKDKGISFDYFDALGGVNINVTPKYILAKAGAKPGLPTAVTPDGYNGLNKNTLFFIRSRNGLYWNIFLNDKKVPVLTDIRPSGFSTQNRIFLMGPFSTPAINLLKNEDTEPRVHTNSKAQIYDVSWCSL